ncbi:hypothetical protein MRX96_008730 [Rhipicephalus microplus]
MWASWLSKESTKAIVRLQPAWSLDTGAYESLKPWVHAENLRALDAVRFSQPAIHADQQYLDVGCGSGSFTKEALLPRVRPECRRIVAVDRCKKGASSERYGAFDRVYSFLTFHYVADITKAYGNVCKLLKQGGECLVLSVVKADAIDVWNEVYQMEEWNALIINPASLFPGMVHSDSAIRSAEQLASHTRESISTAGLHCLTYYRYNSRWVFRRMEDYVDAFMSSFKAHNGVPPEKQSTLRDVWIDLFQKKTHVGDAAGSGDDKCVATAKRLRDATKEPDKRSPTHSEEPPAKAPQGKWLTLRPKPKIPSDSGVLRKKQKPPLPDNSKLSVLMALFTTEQVHYNEPCGLAYRPQFMITCRLFSSRRYKEHQCLNLGPGILIDELLARTGSAAAISIDDIHGVLDPIFRDELPAVETVGISHNALPKQCIPFTSAEVKQAVMKMRLG